MLYPLHISLFVLLAASFLQLTLARDDCYGPIVELALSPEPASGSPQHGLVRYGVLAGVGSNLSQPMTGLRVVAADPLTACGTVAAVAAGSAVLVIRGDCTFTEKVLAVQRAGAAAMLLYNNERGCVTMAFELNATAAISASLAVVSLPQAVGLQLQKLTAATSAASGDGGAGGGPALSMRLVDVSLVDSGAAVLWLLAVGTVVAGSVWSGADHLASRRAATEDQDPLLRGSSAADKGPAGTDTVDLTPHTAVAFVAVASVMLLLLYFLLNRVFFFVLLGLFSLAAIQAQTVLYSAALQPLMPKSRRQVTVQLPLLGACPLTGVLALPVAAAVTVVWAIQRNTGWAWVLQDLQGVALMLLVLRTLRVPSLKVAAVLLPACLLYDVFWVFVQPMLFGGGKSVMVEVAQGGSSGELVPMLLHVPHFGFGGLGGSSLLGFGDVILPGMLVAFTRRVDLDMGLSMALRAPATYLQRSYFPYTVLSYGAGLCLTYTALAFSWFGDQGQPALLYLVPCTLLTVVGLAAARRQLAVLWKGETLGPAARRPGTDHDSDAGDTGPPSPPALAIAVDWGFSKQAEAASGICGGRREIDGEHDLEAGSSSMGMGLPAKDRGGAGLGLGLRLGSAAAAAAAAEAGAGGFTSAGSSSGSSSSGSSSSVGVRGVGGAARRADAAARLLQ